MSVASVEDRGLMDDGSWNEAHSQSRLRQPVEAAALHFGALRHLWVVIKCCSPKRQRAVRGTIGQGVLPGESVLSNT